MARSTFIRVPASLCLSWPEPTTTSPASWCSMPRIFSNWRASPGPRNRNSSIRSPFVTVIVPPTRMPRSQCMIWPRSNWRGAWCPRPRSTIPASAMAVWHHGWRWATSSNSRCRWPRRR
jgi:hypothetical protein